MHVMYMQCIGHLLEGLPERRQNVSRVRVRDPELGGDVDIVPGGERPSTHGLRHGVADRALRAVHRGCVEVAVAGVQGAEDGLPYDWAIPGVPEREGCRAEAYPRHRLAGAQCHCRHRGPCCLIILDGSHSKATVSLTVGAEQSWRQAA